MILFCCASEFGAPRVFKRYRSYIILLLLLLNKIFILQILFTLNDQKMITTHMLNQLLPESNKVGITTPNHSFFMRTYIYLLLKFNDQKSALANIEY